MQVLCNYCASLCKFVQICASLCMFVQGYASLCKCYILLLLQNCKYKEIVVILIKTCIIDASSIFIIGMVLLCNFVLFCLILVVLKNVEIYAIYASLCKFCASFVQFLGKFMQVCACLCDFMQVCASFV